jgi:hypothetical protein
MSKTFATMKTNIGNMVQDKSTTFATLIGVWINDRYQEIARRYAWSALIDNDYTFNTAASTAEYNFPTAFEQEIFVANITDGEMLIRYDEQGWWRERYGAYNAGVITGGSPRRYIILRESSKIRLDPTPDAIKTIAFPYKKTITALSGNTDTVLIPDIEVAIEYGAIGDALAYKKQYQKADYYFQRFEDALVKRAGQDKAQKNLMYQRISQSFQIPKIGRLTGESSYDTI